MNQSEKFWNKIAERYSKRAISDEAVYQKKLQVTREYFRPDMEVLEFGCGTGGTAIIHAPYVKHIRAIDFSENMLAIARSKAADSDINNITFERASIEELNVSEQSLDIVLGLNILHLLENKEAVIAQVYTMLKPNGVFVISTICIKDTFKVFTLIASIGKLMGLMPLLKFFTTKNLESALLSAGFEIDYCWQPEKSKSLFIVARK